MVLLDTFEHVVGAHWHTAALFCKFFAASYRGCSVFIGLRLSDIEVGNRNEDGNRHEPRWHDRCRDGTITDRCLDHFFLQNFYKRLRDVALAS
ncbi:MAG: hypothetical protein WBW11_19015 [Pseudolabrys sp.]